MVLKFLREVKLEMEKTTWPSRKEVGVVVLTVGVVVTIASLFFLLADYLIYNTIDFFLNIGG